MPDASPCASAHLHGPYGPYEQYTITHLPCSPVQVMSGPEETAQVHPKQLTLALIRAAKHCTLRMGTVTGISTDDRGRVTGEGCS